jgi:hypothetical protein
MRELIIELFNKNIKYLQSIQDLQKSKELKLDKKIRSLLIDGHVYLLDRKSNLYLFTNALDKYCKEEQNQFYTRALINDLIKISDKYSDTILDKFPEFIDSKGVEDYEYWVRIPLNSNFIIAIKNAIELDDESFDNPMFQINILNKINENQIKEFIINLLEFYRRRIVYILGYTITFNHSIEKLLKTQSADFSFFKSAPVKNEDINEYLQKWVDMSVTVDDWLNHKKINLEEELEHWGLEDEEMNNIIQHKYNLFTELKDRILKNRLIDPFEKIFPESDKIITAKRDLDLIDCLIDGKIDEVKEKRLRQTLFIKSWKITATHFDYIFRHKYKNEYNYDIHHEDSFLDAHIIISYRKYLNDYLTSIDNAQKENETKSVKKEIDINSIIPEAKQQFIFQLLNDISITSNGIYVLGEKKKSAIRGVIDALIEKNVVPQIPLNKLSVLIADKIGLDIKDLPEISNTSKKYKKLAQIYISENYKS